MAEGQFLVWLIKVRPAFFRFRVGFFAPWLGKYRVSMNAARHAILPSYGEGIPSRKRLVLTRVHIEASQCDAGHLVRDTKGIFFA